MEIEGALVSHISQEPFWAGLEYVQLRQDHRRPGDEEEDGDEDENWTKDEGVPHIVHRRSSDEGLMNVHLEQAQEEAIMFLEGLLPLGKKERKKETKESEMLWNEDAR